MNLETGVAVFAIIHLSIMGLSHIFAHRAWASYGLKKLGRVSLERSRMFIPAGIGLLVLSAVVLAGVVLQ